MTASKKKFRLNHRLILPASLEDWTKLSLRPLPAEISWPALEKKIPPAKIPAWRDYHYRWGQALLENLPAQFQLKAEIYEIFVGPSATATDHLELAGDSLEAEVIFPEQGESGRLTLSGAVAKHLAAENLGQGFAALTGSQPLTDLDLVNLKVILEKILSWLPPLPDNKFPGAVKVQGLVRNTAAAPPDKHLAAGIKIAAGSPPGWLTIHYPEALLLKVLPGLPETNSPAKQLVRLSQNSLAGLPVTARVVLGSSTVTTGDLSRLKEGDVVLLDKPLNEPVEILFGEQIKLSGGPGLSGGHLAVQILPAAGTLPPTAAPRIISPTPEEKKEVEPMKGKEYFSDEKERYLEEDLEETELKEEKAKEPEEIEKEIDEDFKEEEEKKEEEKEETEEDDDYEEYDEDEEDEI